MTPPTPTISLIVPSLHGVGPALRASIEQQDIHVHDTAFVEGVRPNGRARNQGVARTTGDILVFVDDDAVLGSPDVVANLVAPLLADTTVGITGATRILPPDAPPWQRRVAREVPRTEHPIAQHLTETNPDPPFYYCDITATCCAMRRAVFEEAGGFNNMLIRGVDTDMFVRIRQMGYRFLLVPHTWVYHPAPANLRALLRKHFAYGLGSSQLVRLHPDWKIGRYLHTPLHAVAYLLFRTLILVPNIFLPYSHAAPSWRPGFKPLKALTSYTGALGYVWGWYTAPTPSPDL